MYLKDLTFQSATVLAELQHNKSEKKPKGQNNLL